MTYNRGTIGYMSPDQVRGKSADARSDNFSFGVVLCEMLSGQKAFHGESNADVISAILNPGGASHRHVLLWSAAAQLPLFRRQPTLPNLALFPLPPA